MERRVSLKRKNAKELNQGQMNQHEMMCSEQGSCASPHPQFPHSAHKCGIEGKDKTMLVIKNLPAKMKWKSLLQAINVNNKATYDFLYMPIVGNIAVGYAFINLLSPELVMPFYKEFNAYKWDPNCKKSTGLVQYSEIQSKSQILNLFGSSNDTNRNIILLGDKELKEDNANVKVRQQNGDYAHFKLETSAERVQKQFATLQV